MDRPHGEGAAPEGAEGGGAGRPGSPDRAREQSRALTLRGAQDAVDRWISRFEEGYWPPLANLARLTEEVGELARELNHRFGAKPKKPDEPDADLALELADILFVLIAMANEQEIDLEDAFGKVLEKYEVRDAERWTEK